MFMIQTSVDRKWVNQGKVDSREKAVDHIKAHGSNLVEQFKTCDCIRAIEIETEEVIIQYPTDFEER